MTPLILTAQEGGERLDAFVASQVEDLTRSAAQRLLEQRDPVKYVQTLDFKPDWVSCEYHTAYQQPSMVQKLHDLGIKAAYWTVDGEQAVKDLWPLQPDAIVTNRPDRVREWISELEMTE